MMVIYNAEDLAYLLFISYVVVLEEETSRVLFLLSEAQDEPAKRAHYLEEHDDGFEICNMT